MALAVVGPISVWTLSRKARRGPTELMIAVITHTLRVVSGILVLTVRNALLRTPRFLLGYMMAFLLT